MFIKLTHKNGSPRLINLDHVEQFQPTNEEDFNKDTIVHLATLSGDEEGFCGEFVMVQEGFNWIEAKIESMRKEIK